MHIYLAIDNESFFYFEIILDLQKIVVKIVDFPKW